MAILATAFQTHAANITFDTVAAVDPSLGTAWVGGTAPGDNDTMVFGSTSGTTPGTGLTMSGTLSVYGILLQSTQNGITFSNTNSRTITIGAGGIDLSGQTSGKGLNLGQKNSVALSADQTWTTKSGCNLAIYGLKSSLTGSARTLTLAGDGNIVMYTATYTNDINIVGGAGATVSIGFQTNNNINVNFSLDKGSATSVSISMMNYNKVRNWYGNANINGSINLSAGQLYVQNGAQFVCAPVTSGSYNVSGSGSLRASGAGTVFKFDSESAGTGGVARIGSLTADTGASVTIGGRGNLGNQLSFLATNGTLNISDADTQVNFTNSSLTVNSATNSAVTSTINLNSGSLNVLGLGFRGNANNGTALVNFNGGTLKFTDSQGIGLADDTTGAIDSTSVSNLATLNVQAGGAVIDTNGYDNQVTQAFVHDAALGDTTPDGGLIKKGAASLTLRGVNTYTGATQVKAGTLKIASTGSIDKSSGISVSSGASFDVRDFSTQYNVLKSQTLTNNGTVLGNVAVSGTVKGSGTITGSLEIADGGMLAPGNSPGLLTVQNGLTLDPNSIFSFDLDSNTDAENMRGVEIGGYDGVDITGGALTIGSNVSAQLVFGSSVDFTQAFWQSSHTWLVFDNAEGSTTTATDADIFHTITTSTNGYAGDFTFSYGTGANNNDVYLNYTVVPEPSTWAMLVGGVGALAFGQRLNRRRKA